MTKRILSKINENLKKHRVRGLQNILIYMKTRVLKVDNWTDYLSVYEINSSGECQPFHNYLKYQPTKLQTKQIITFLLFYSLLYWIYSSLWWYKESMNYGLDGSTRVALLATGSIFERKIFHTKFQFQIYQFLLLYSCYTLFS